MSTIQLPGSTSTRDALAARLAGREITAAAKTAYLPDRRFGEVVFVLAGDALLIAVAELGEKPTIEERPASDLVGWRMESTPLEHHVVLQLSGEPERRLRLSGFELADVTNLLASTLAIPAYCGRPPPAGAAVLDDLLLDGPQVRLRKKSPPLPCDGSALARPRYGRWLKSRLTSVQCAGGPSSQPEEGAPPPAEPAEVVAQVRHEERVGQPARPERMLDHPPVEDRRETQEEHWKELVVEPPRPQDGRVKGLARLPARPRGELGEEPIEEPAEPQGEPDELILEPVRWPGVEEPSLVARCAGPEDEPASAPSAEETELELADLLVEVDTRSQEEARPAGHGSQLSRAAIEDPATDTSLSRRQRKALREAAAAGPVLCCRRCQRPLLSLDDAVLSDDGPICERCDLLQRIEDDERLAEQVDRANKVGVNDPGSAAYWERLAAETAESDDAEDLARRNESWLVKLVRWLASQGD
ncbi:MAG: hypothetical protein FJ109_09910 [Deltaproteobacteria bacterium]|nr:hypothetical protein [Deltaproteobacteria bacterium]